MTQPTPDSNIQPSIDTIASAYEEVLQHNRSNTGFGGLFGGILSAAIEVEKAKPDATAEDIYTAVDKKLEDNAQIGDMKGDLQSVLHDEAFMRIGLKLSQDGSPVASVDNRKASSVELKPQLENTELFAEFIEGLDGGDASDHEAVLRLVADVNLVLMNRINVCFGNHDLSELTKEQMDMLPEVGEDALRAFARLEQAYEKAGIIHPEIYERKLAHGEPQDMGDWRNQYAAKQYKAQMETLQSYVEYWGRGVLSERIQIGTPESNLSVDLAYFDGFQDSLTEDVDSIIEVVNKQHSHEFGLEVAASKLQSLENTLKLMDDDPEHWIVGEKNRKLVEDNIAKLKAVISN